MTDMPEAARQIVEEISDNPALNVGLAKTARREAEFASSRAAVLAGIALHEPAREHFEQRLDEMWAKTELPDEVDEIIVGGGLHAAIYASVRVAEGHPPPLVLERGRAGGIFAVSRRPSFFLSMANRPGPADIPGGRGSLGVLPRVPIQPADISASDYQRNTDMAFAIRSALLMHAQVKTNEEVFGIEDVIVNGRQLTRVRLGEDDSVIARQRVIIATGLGSAKRMTALKDPRLLTFPEFMARMDEDFPLQDMHRVAVIGAGDSGKCAIEALTGQGPQSGMSVASMDFVEQIDWYGVSGLCRTRENWGKTARLRYRGIGRFLPRDDGPPSRVTPRDPLKRFSVGYDVLFGDDRPYDHVIDCTGFSFDQPLAPEDWSPQNVAVASGNRNLGTVYRGHKVYVVGPAANLSVTDSEKETLASVPENSAAIFRYADRTAALAASFPKILDDVQIFFEALDKLPSPPSFPNPVAEPVFLRRPNRSYIRDAKQQKIYVGARVEVTANGLQGTVMGVVDRGNIIGVKLDAPLIKTSYAVNGEPAYGVNPKNLIVLP